jgi:opacity protein-like surface antigen
MKNIVLSAVAVLAMSSFAVAGGDIAPVEEPVVVVEEAVSTGNFYLGLAYGAANFDNTYTEEYNGGITPSIPNPATNGTQDWDYSTVMLQAGYNFNKYIAIEGRYWFGLDEGITDPFGDNADLSIDTWGIYVKPQYPVTEAFNIYALLGYASSDAAVEYADGDTHDFDNVDGFSWGIGASYAFTENISIFVDYVDMYNDDNSYDDGDWTYTDDITLSTVNFGVTYNF